MAMAWIWTGMAAVSLIFAAWNGTMDAVGAAALEGAGAHAGAKTLARKCQEMIDGLEVDMATIDELQEIHDRE